MSDLSFREKEKLEKIYEMSSGFVMSFSNRTFKEFILESVGKNIYDSKYEVNGDSKANRLRTFWQLEPNSVVGKLIKDLLDYALKINSNLDKALFEKCKQVANRLLQETSSEIDLNSEYLESKF
jgi:hypothetical protein